MLIYDNFSKKCHVTFKKILLLLWKFLSYLVCAPGFKSINSSSLSTKKYDGDNFTPISCKRLWGQNTSVEIWLSWLNLLNLLIHWITSHILNIITFYKLLYTYFQCLYLCGKKSFVLKTELYFTFLWFGLA